MSTIKNPILKGFNPDPSICRVGDDYYIATSTFEWFPGVAIHHSKDLVNWELIAYPLNRVNQLNMLGTPNSGGVWAPCLSYSDGKFHLIYSNVKSTGIAKDVPNYLVTSDSITGEWSDPIYFNCSGFDPSLFHDDNGRKWFVNMKNSNKYGENRFDGILLQEYDPKLKKLVGPIENIFKGTELKLTEGPHLYKKNGYYYLMVAEGGTGYEHAVTLTRSKSITGPYEVHPTNPILTSYGTDMETTLQKAGHASIVDTPNGDWYMAHLCARPLKGTKRCILGRETALQKVEWREDDWLYLCKENKYPSWEVDSTLLVNDTVSPSVIKDDFDNDTLDINYNTLRVPQSTKILSLSERKGWLRLFGRESLESTFEQSLVARRQQTFCYVTQTCLEFNPNTSQHMAGLVCYYNTYNFYYLRMSFDEEKEQNCLGILANANADYSKSMLQKDNVFIGTTNKIYLRTEMNYSCLKFYYSLDNKTWTQIGQEYDSSTLSDEFSNQKCAAFTGAYVGLCCQDLSYGGHHADFDYFIYQEK